MSELRSDCRLRHDNGNCLCVGGFCTAVNDEICSAVRMAYEKGRTDYAYDYSKPKPFAMEVIIPGNLLVRLLKYWLNVHSPTLERCITLHEAITGKAIKYLI